jgi:RNA-directed DNA polymerase
MQATREMVSPNEATSEVRRDGPQGVGTPHGTEEVGEPNRGDPMEGRGCRALEPLGGNMAGTSGPDNVFTKQQRIAALAKQSPRMGFTSLNHHLDLAWLLEAYNRTRKDAAPGVDGTTSDDYELTLLDNLKSLLERAKSGSYFAPPVRRVHIPKGTGTETRPIGIPTFEDKILQRAVAMVLEPIYEQDFLNCSYGFRPGRSAHQALQALRQQASVLGGCWLVEVDVRKFFDTLDHAHLRELLRQRLRDGVLLRLIGKWLKAGVLEDGNVTYPEAGSPQGGVISPMLSNVFLHYVVDVWFEQVVKPCLKGRAFLVRYADDFVMGFACEEDARRVLDVLPKRLGKYGLTIHPDKTRLVRFRPPESRGSDGGLGARSASESFDFLGFTHYWGRTKSGHWVLRQKTAGSRFQRAVMKIKRWCRLNRHEPVKEQCQALSQKLRGHFAYYGGVTGNFGCLKRFRHEVVRLWQKWLSRRKRRGQFTWGRMKLWLSQLAFPDWRTPPIAAKL